MLQACNQCPSELLSFQPMKCFPGNAVGISSSLIGCWLSSCCAFGAGRLAVCPGKADANRKGKSPKQASSANFGHDHPKPALGARWVRLCRGSWGARRELMPLLHCLWAGSRCNSPSRLLSCGRGLGRV